MKIESYQIHMDASSKLIKKHESKTSVETINQVVFQSSSSQDVISSHTNKAIYHDEENLSIEDKIKKRIIELMLEKITQQTTKIYPSKELDIQPIKNNENLYSKSIQAIPTWGFIFENTEEYYQKNALDFSSQAIIKTANKEFTIDLNISFSQEFYEVHKNRLEVGVVQIQDPLIIHFAENGNAFDTISQNLKFAFDIQSNGQKVDIPLLKEGSGFLALDKNLNGSIDSGNELFGPKSGDGFLELKNYDKNKNNWIDENDTIFNQLRIWEKDEQGNDNLLTLGQLSIGAIYLGSIASSFNYDQSIEKTNAKLTQSSLFLKENGNAGVISSVHFSV